MFELSNAGGWEYSEGQIEGVAVKQMILIIAEKCQMYLLWRAGHARQ